MGRRIYDWAAIRGCYEAGREIGECQERFGFSDGAWHHAVKRGLITPRAVDVGGSGGGAPRRPPGETRLQVERLARAGHSQAEIAAKLQVARPTVCFHMRKLGIPAREDLGRRFDWAAIRA